MSIAAKLKQLRISLVIPKAQGSYIPAVKFGNLITTSGQLPLQDSRLVFPGHVGKDISIENAQRAAKAAVLNCLSAIASIESLDRIKKIVRLNGFVSSHPDFTDQPKVLNAASELLTEIFGEEIAAHTRCAIGVAALPLGSCIELDLTVEVM